MSWYDIIKLRQDSWNALTQVIIGEYDYELWKDTPIPEEIKEMKKNMINNPKIFKIQLGICYKRVV